MSTRALQQYHESGMRLAREVDSKWDALVGMRSEAEEIAALVALQQFIDRYRDACADLAAASQRLDLDHE